MSVCSYYWQKDEFNDPVSRMKTECVRHSSYYKILATYMYIHRESHNNQNLSES